MILNIFQLLMYAKLSNYYYPTVEVYGSCSEGLTLDRAPYKEKPAT
jgi:hypothetical protein